MSLLLALALLATAQVPATFYNRPGATPAMLVAELRRCRTIITGPDREAGRALTAPIAVPEDVDAAPARSPTIEDCMVLRGWRVYALDGGERATLEALSPDARANALAKLRAAEDPERGTLRHDRPRIRLHRKKMYISTRRHVYCCDQSSTRSARTVAIGRKSRKGWEGRGWKP